MIGAREGTQGRDKGRDRWKFMGRDRGWVGVRAGAGEGL